MEDEFEQRTYRALGAFAFKAKEAKSIKEHDMLGRYINLDGLLSLNLF